MDELLTAVAAPRRRAILGLVRRRERSAGDIHRALGDLTFGAVSQHLAVLERAGLVRVRRDGRSRLYQARLEGLVPLRDWLGSMWDDALGALAAEAEAEEARDPVGVRAGVRRTARRGPARHGPTRRRPARKGRGR
jgi:DNA-binding transcriptional ArsR family regulator